MTTLLKAIRRWFSRDLLADAEAAPKGTESMTSVQARNAEGAGHASQTYNSPPW